MPKQSFESFHLTPKTKPANKLEYGELGEVLEGAFTGCMLTKSYRNLVAVYCPGDREAFKTTFDYGFTAQVRVLEQGERVILEN